MSVYDYPEVYATLMYPESDLLEHLLGWLEEHLEGPMNAVMDPCCGPGTWLVPFAARGYRVAGNDGAEGMIGEARRRLAELELEEEPELTVGDMRELPLTSGPFDVTINLHASVGHLPDEESVVRHLRSVASQMRPGGIYLCGIIVSDGQTVETEPELLYESDPLPMASGGMAACHYSSTRRDHVKGEETIQVLILTTEVPDTPERIEDSYVLRSYTAETWERILAEAGGFELLAAHSMADDRYLPVKLDETNRDCTLVLRRTAD